MSTIDIEIGFPNCTGPNVHRVLAIMSWVMVIVVQTIYGFWRAPTIWAVNERHQTTFALNGVAIYICWYTLLVLQTKYLHLLCFSAGAKENDNVKKYTAINGHFVAYNVLHVLWIVSWVSSQFWLGEVFLVLNFVHLWPLYLDNNLDRRGCHQSIIAGPLAWTCYGLFMNGAILLDGHSQLSGGEADLCFLAMFCLSISVVLVHKDYALAYCFTALFCAQGSQHKIAGIRDASTWPIASVIGVTFLVIGLVLHLLVALGKEFKIRHELRQ